MPTLNERLIAVHAAIAGHLKTWLRVKNTRAALTNEVTACVNSTADAALLSLTLPANTLLVGDTLAFQLAVLASCPILSGATFSFWLKNNAGVKVLTLSHSAGSGSLSGAVIQAHGSLTVKAAGASGKYSVGGFLARYAGGGDAGAVQSGTLAIDTTVANTLTLGCSCSTANAGISVVAKQAGLWLR